MKIIKWYVRTNIVGSKVTGEIEVDDDATDSEIEEYARDAVNNVFEWGWNAEDGNSES